jgi:hypothetical protein
VLFLCALGLWLRLSLLHNHWVFAGSDSFGYIDIGDEWKAHGRFAFGPAPSPLEWYRRPLYPIFISIVKGGEVIKRDWGAGWARVVLSQILCEALLLWPMVYFAARRIGGGVAGVVALALVTSFIPSMLFTEAVLTESLAMSFAALAVFPLLWHSRRTTIAWIVAAIGAALSALLRPDGVLWVAAAVPCLFGKVPRGANKGRAIVSYLILFVAIFGAWPVRNIKAFNDAHLTDGMIDRLGNDIPNYRGFWSWMRTWSDRPDAAGFPASCFYDRTCPGVTAELYSGLGAFDAPATTSVAERAVVSDALAERARYGITPRVSALFSDLANDRARAHPFRVYVQLPVLRAIRAWRAPQTELQRNVAAWPSLAKSLVPDFPQLSLLLFWVTLAAAVALLCLAETRQHALILIAGLVARSAALGWTGFCLARYVVPGYPMCFVLVGGGAGALINRCVKSLTQLQRDPGDPR